MEHKTRIKERHQDRHHCQHEFGCKDERGRAIGAMITTGVHEFVELEGNEQSYYSTRAPGRYFYFCPHATRDCQTFGPVQPDHYFDTPRQRDKAIETYLANAKKRAEKKARIAEQRRAA